MAIVSLYPTGDTYQVELQREIFSHQGSITLLIEVGITAHSTIVTFSLLYLLLPRLTGMVNR